MNFSAVNLKQREFEIKISIAVDFSELKLSAIDVL